MRYLFFILVLFLYGSINSQSRVILNENCKTAYHDILSLRFDKAKSILENEKQSNPDNIYTYYLENYIDFLSVFISEDEDLFEEFEDRKSVRVDQIKEIDVGSPYRNYLLGNINLQWAVARLKFREYFTASIEINKAYRLLESNLKNHPDFIPNTITMGVLHIMIGLVPDKYHWLLNLINMEGSVTEGKNELSYVLKHTMENGEYSYLKNEVLFYLGFVEMNIHPDKDKLKYLLTQLEKSEENNLLLSYLSINILMRTGYNEKAIEKFDNLPESENYYPFHYLEYLKAETFLRKLDYTEATLHYQKFLQVFQGQNFIKDAYRKLAWIKLLNADTVGYADNISSTADHGNSFIGQDKDAQREADTKFIPNVDLIKARLLFDGGYYHQADSILNTMNDLHLSEDQKIEQVYRRARIAHQMNNAKRAKQYYFKTIERGSKSPRYFAGNSALKLGELYESDSNYSEAVFYYKVCLDLDFEEYESGIHSKAKAGLRRISNN